MSDRFRHWLDRHSGDDWHWYVKRLAANDTRATGSHQAGPYLPKKQAFLLFPTLHQPTVMNPKVWLASAIDSHSRPERDICVSWYNQGTRDECHMTRWGGVDSPVLHPDSTGAACVFAFRKVDGKDADFCSVWVCSAEEEEVLEERIGPVEPGTPLLHSNSLPLFEVARTTSCSFTQDSIPSDWLTRFPSGDEIVRHCVTLRPERHRNVDARLVIRRDCEYEMFRSIESFHVLPRVTLGFKTVDEFITYSNSVNNRRKSRSGRSLELHVSNLLREENVPFSHGEISEGNKKPDFLFPSADAYHRRDRPLWMLAAKTTCKDRWRQILNEADEIPRKHLITLQEGVSENQFNEMSTAGVTLVVPFGLHKRYPVQLRHKLMTLGAFMAMVSSASS